jgi:hypothetical protein
MERDFVSHHKQTARLIELTASYQLRILYPALCSQNLGKLKDASITVKAYANFAVTSVGPSSCM